MSCCQKANTDGPRMHPMQKDLTTIAMHDIHEDLDCMETIILSNINRIQKFVKKINSLQRNLPKTSVDSSIEHANALIYDYQKLLFSIKTLKRHVTPNTNKQITELNDAIRSRQGLLGSVLVSTDWQSPSFASSSLSQAGSQTGKIYATMNDYKRDQHWGAYDYEQAFLKEYIDGIFKLPIHIYATASGMAAFTTILNYLTLEKKIKGPILIGTSIYFENKELLLKTFGNQVIEVNEHDTKHIIQTIESKQPSAIFLDSLTNAPDLVTPDVDTIIPFVVNHAKKETFVVIDNTGRSIMLQPLKHILGRWTKTRLIVFESLNKYHQFGMDRVTGGIIWSYGGDTGKLFDYRDHLGTNIPDVAASSLPLPNRNILTRRLIRHMRNTSILSNHLQSWIDKTPTAPFARIVHAPGSYFVIEMKPQYATIPFYKRLMREIINEAKQQHVDIVAGTSFGLSTTRVYITAVRYNKGTPFFRVAVGTEHQLAIEAVKNVFTRAFERLSTNN
jgi:cystathionine beta-lyase/cystathionine gamma-synthase